jgi:cytochrome b561
VLWSLLIHDCWLVGGPHLTFSFLTSVRFRLVSFVQYKVEKLPGASGIEHGLANLGHLGLYVFLTVMPATGIAMGYYGGTKHLSLFWCRGFVQILLFVAVR